MVMNKRKSLIFQRALVTGATGGLGRELVKALCEISQNLILSGTNLQELKDFSAELKDEFQFQGQIDLIPLDLSVAIDLSKISLLQQEVDLVINNAGIGFFGPLAQMSNDDISSMLMVNNYNLTMLNKFFTDKMLSRGYGQVINISSMAGFFPIPYYSVYAASKAYVLSLSVALDQEVRSHHVRVKALCPAGIKTSFNQKARLNAKELIKHSKSFSEPSDIAKMAMQLIHSSEGVLIPGRSNRWAAFFMRLLPLSVSSYFAKKSQEKFLNLN
jgi:short-subunit dehydrogenase